MTGILPESVFGGHGPLHGTQRAGLSREVAGVEGSGDEGQGGVLLVVGERVSRLRPGSNGG